MWLANESRCLLFLPLATEADAAPTVAVMANALGAPPGPRPLLPHRPDPAAILEYLDAVLDYVATALTTRGSWLHAPSFISISIYIQSSFAFVLMI